MSEDKKKESESSQELPELTMDMLKQLKEKYPTAVCPHCGFCPTCGRPYQHFNYPPYPYYPYPNNPYPTVIC